MHTFQMGFRLVCAFLFWTKQILGQPCYTPEKQQGHCVSLNECPEIFDIFANPRIGSETYVRRILCNEVKRLKVCCAPAANFTSLEDDLNRRIVPSDLIDYGFNYCSQQKVSDIDLPLILRESGHCNVEPKKCLGILANPRYVITPAQCVVSNAEGQQLTVVGVKFRGKNNNSPTFAVEEVIPHPFFDPVTGINDIALLRLNQTVSEDNVPVPCIGELLPSFFSPIGVPLLTYSNLALSTIERGLNKTTVVITSLSKEECEEDFQQKGAHVGLTKYDLCTKDVKNVTKFTCNEFTGVPIFLDYGYGYIGFSSSRTVCNDGLPDIYTNLRAYTVWLESQMKPWPKSDPCTTPNGEIGECWHLLYCPVLLDASSSVTNATEAYLGGFFCAEEEFSVCCATSSNSTTALKKDEPKLVDVPIQFLETRLCGLQHRDDYFSSSAAIAIDEFPWIALMQEESEPQIFYISCTGTLINSRYVLSTRDCAAKVDMDNIIIRLGNYNQFNYTSCVKDPDIDATDCTETEKYGVEDIILHPIYMRSVPLNDIGLLRLNKTVTYTDFIRPICLPIPGTVTPKVGDTLYMSSWGDQDDSSKDGIKKKVLTQLIHEEECQQQFPDYHYIKYLNLICTLDYKNNTEFPEFFEEGGPVMFDNNYRWYIVGLVLLNTQRDVPNSYVNVSKYINWIIESMEPW